MSQEEKWPTDARFRRIAAKLADAVMAKRHENPEIKIGDSSGCWCPIGCQIGISRPGWTKAAQVTEMTLDEAFAFMSAFDSNLVEPTEPHFSRLGLAYRRRFVTQEGPAHV